VAEVEVEELGIDRPWLPDGPITAGLTQDFPVGGRIAREGAVARAEIDVALASTRAVALDLEAETVKRFSIALAAQRRIALVRDGHELAKSAQSLVEAAVEAGARPESDLLLSRAALSQSAAEIAGSEADSASALASLAELWAGSPSQISGLDGDLFVPPEMPPAIDQESILQRSPQVQRMQAFEAVSRADVARQEALAVPDLTAGAAGRALPGLDENALVFTLSMPLPLWNRNQGAVDEAAAAARRARYETQAVAASSLSALRSARARKAAAWTMHQALEQEVVPGLAKAVEAVSLRVSAGKSGSFELIDALEKLNVAKLAQLHAAETFALECAEERRLAGLPAVPDSEEIR